MFAKATEDSKMDGPPAPEHPRSVRGDGQVHRGTGQGRRLVAGAGLKNGAQAKRIVFDGPSRTVIDGPFAETRELVAGFSIWEVKDMVEALAWAKRAPNLLPRKKSEMEIRRFYEAADLAEFITRDYAPLPAARGEYLFRAGRLAEARLEFKAAPRLRATRGKGPFCSHGGTPATASPESWF